MLTTVDRHQRCSNRNSHFVFFPLFCYLSVSPPATLISFIQISILRLNWTRSILNEWGWAGGSSICYNTLELMSPPPLSLPSPSLILSGLGLWNAVLGNNSIALIISLLNRGKPPLSEHIVEGWCNLMWHENSSSIFLRTAFLENCPVPPFRCLWPSLFHSLSPSLLSF